MVIDKQKLKLLIVDDEPLIVKGFQEIYSRRGHEVFATRYGNTAVEIFAKERPQICIIDVWLIEDPYEGLDVLRRIKAIDKDVYCILIGTCLDEERIVKQAKEFGVTHLLEKPIPIEVLDKCIGEIRVMIANRDSSIRGN